MTKRIGTVLAFCIFMTFAVIGPSYSLEAEESGGAKTVLNVSRNRISVTITAEPARVEFNKTILLIIRITSPSEINVVMPGIDDRLKGFASSGMFDQNPAPTEGNTVLERHVRLTPHLSNEYRIGPMAILYTDQSRNPATRGWFHTDPIVFETVYPIDREPPDDITADIEPRYIPPSIRTVFIWTGISMLSIGVLYLLWFLFRKLHTRIQLARMSPRERALKELSVLLARNYIDKNLIKQFYLELTMIVRRYIERQHGIKAPEQTTREFLDAVSKDKRFGVNVIEKLKSFLEAADLVKFAAYQPEREKVDNATGTAREFIKNDSGSRNTEKI